MNKDRLKTISHWVSLTIGIVGLLSSIYFWIFAAGKNAQENEQMQLLIKSLSQKSIPQIEYFLEETNINLKNEIERNGGKYQELPKLDLEKGGGGN